MALPFIDLSIISVFFASMLFISYWLGKKNENSTDYFLGKKDTPWWAISASVVATETSTLSFIGVPAISFFGNLNFIQLLFGYIIGRFVIARFFLPLYINGELRTTYEYIGKSFGKKSQRASSALFLVTRLLGDGVRLYATALPLKLLTGWDLWLSILIIMIVTIVFASLGGIKTIIWTDFIQLVIYMIGAGIALFFIFQKLDPQSLLSQIPSEKWAVFNFEFSFSNAYSFYWAISGGFLLTLATHGTDQLMVQRVLCSKNLKDAQKAMKASGIVVFIQLSFFLFIGLVLYLFFQQESLQFASSQRNEVFPYFIVHYLPVGLSGLVIASIFSAAISTLSSTLNSMASASRYDFQDKDHSIRKAKILSIIWGLILTLLAFLFQYVDKNVVNLALGIASILYGGILAVFILAKLEWNLSENQLITSLFSGIIPVFILWLYQLNNDTLIAWTLFIPIGSSISLSCAFFLKKKH